MSNKETGGPAFPFNKRPEQAFPSTFKSLDGKEQIHAWGMTLRDYFAARALPQCLEVCGTKITAAEESYRVADAMLKAREA
jgi:hypothetical protein